MSPGDAPPISIAQILMLRDARACEELTEALWAAFKEVEAFYNHDRARVIFRRANLSAHVPDVIRYQDSLDARQRLGSVDMEANWKDTRGRYARTVDHEKVSQIARSIAGVEPGTRAAIVIDQELTPPPQWRYIIFNGDSEGAVISIAPLDPRYWSEHDRFRIQTIKHRARASCMTVVGEVIGLDRCENPECFLFSSIDAVTALDRMVLLGEEHQIPPLARRGFRVRPSDPGAVQPIELDPEPLLPV